MSKISGPKPWLFLSGRGRARGLAPPSGVAWLAAVLAPGLASVLAVFQERLGLAAMLEVVARVIVIASTSGCASTHFVDTPPTRPQFCVGTPGLTLARNHLLVRTALTVLHRGAT